MYLKYKIVFALSTGMFAMFLWGFLISPGINNPADNFNYNTQYEGTASFVENIGDQLPEPTSIISTYTQKVVNTKYKTLEIDTQYITRDFNENILWEIQLTHSIDRKTGKYLEHDDAFFKFPTHTQKQNYHAYIYASGNPQYFVFEDEDNIQGLDVYRFSCELTDDISASYPEYFEEQILSDYNCMIWIEPVTGKEIRYEEMWFDYIPENDSKIPISSGTGHTTNYATSIIIDDTKKKIQLNYFNEVIVPIFIIASTLVALIILVLQHKLELARQEMIKKDQRVKVGEFSYRLAHDMRNPLHVLQIAVLLLKDEPSNTKLSDPKIINWIDMMERGLNRIDHQVNGVLEFIKERKMKYTKNSIHKIIHETLQSIIIPDKIEIDVIGEDFEIECDSVAVGTVLTNLVTNAIQAITEEGNIKIRTVDQEDSIAIEVENSGPSIPEDELPKIFDMLFTTKEEGTGLGLTSCKHLIEQHHGSMSVKNHPVTFTIKLPKSQF